MNDVYLDNSATTIVCKESADKILEMLTKNYGNPSSFHNKGIEAEKELIYARKIVSQKIKCNENEVYFTSGGTEANNIAIFGVCEKRKKRGNKIIVSALEHSSVIEPAQELEKRGFTVIYIKPNEYGEIQEEDIEKEIDENTILISIMYINNEVGVIEPIDNIKKIIKRKNLDTLFHVDAVQAFGKIDISVKKIDVDLMTISAHKIHGPKGVGVLYIKKGVLISPLFYGGKQERKIRPATEAIPLIAGFSKAVEMIPSLKDGYEYIASLRDDLILKLKDIEHVRINSREDGFPYIVNFSIYGIRSETMLHHLSENGVCVSSGSACTKGEKSHVLKSMSLNDDIIDSAIRVSFSRYNTHQDINILIDAIKEGIKRIKKR